MISFFTEPSKSTCLTRCSITSEYFIVYLPHKINVSKIIIIQPSTSGNVHLCFHLFHKPSTSFANCPDNVFNGQRIQYRIIRFIFILMKKALSLSGYLCHLLWIYNIWHWPSHSHLAFFLVINLERHCKVYRRETPVTRRQPLLCWWLYFLPVFFSFNIYFLMLWVCFFF